MITLVRVSPCRSKCSVAWHPLHIVPGLNKQNVGANKSLTPIHKPLSSRVSPRASPTNKERHAQRARTANLPQCFSQPKAMKHHKTNPKTPQASNNPLRIQHNTHSRKSRIIVAAVGWDIGSCQRLALRCRQTTEARLGVGRNQGGEVSADVGALITEA